ncbi:MAG TPA: hypothetical protein VNU44_13700 [Bryobacteraceae bacterium]|nr:hypothetical protein [Bryobacteraceae bacterium]
MRNIFKYRCTRRMRPAVEENTAVHEQPFGAGSGGDLTAIATMHEGWYSEGANVMTLTAQKHEGSPLIPVLSLLAGSDDSTQNGRVEVHGSQGVRITTGPPKMPSASSTATNGVEIYTGDANNIRLRRGFTAESMQSLYMTQHGITMEAGNGDEGILIESDVNLTLQVGPSSIIMTPAGITIKGLMVHIN